MIKSAWHPNRSRMNHNGRLWQYHPLTGCLLAMALAGCQTTQALEQQFSVKKETYATFQGKLIDTAAERIVPTTNNTTMRLLFGDDGILGVKADKEDKKIPSGFRAEHSEALSSLTPRELELRSLQADSIRELTGKGVKALTAYLDGIVKRLMAHWPYKNKPDISVAIISSDDYAASMSENNVLRINTAVLLNADDEDEVAAVLAHELSHALFSHHNADEEAELENRSIRMAAQTAGTIIASGTKSRGSANIMVGLVAAGNYFGRLNNTVLHPAWKRHQEDEADLLGVDLLYRADYDWERMLTVLERLDSEEKRINAEKARQKAEMEKYSKKAGEITSITELLNTGIAKVTSDFSRALSGNEDDHPPASERLKDVKLYLQREYMSGDFPPEDDRRSLEKAVWEGPGFSAIKKSVYGERAVILAERGQLDEARELALKSLDGPNDTDPSARKVLYLARKKQGQENKALLNLEIAVKDPQAGMDIYEFLRTEYIANHRFDDALKIWRATMKKFPAQITTEIYVIEQIRLLRLAGHTETMTTVLQQCMTSHLSQTAKQGCHDAAFPPPSAKSSPNNTPEPLEDIPEAPPAPAT